MAASDVDPVAKPFARTLLNAKRNKTMSESSDGSLAELEEIRNRSGSLSSAVDLRGRSSSITAREDIGAAPTNAKSGLDGKLYDKYLANFFNPLHAKPTGEGVAPESKSKGVLYDLDGKFAYSTYSEEMRSYHPMLDIKNLTKDLK